MRHFEYESELILECHLVSQKLTEWRHFRARLSVWGFSAETVVPHGNCWYSVYAMKTRIKRQRWFHETDLLLSRLIHHISPQLLYMQVLAGHCGREHKYAASVHRRRKHGCKSFWWQESPYLAVDNILSPAAASLGSLWKVWGQMKGIFFAWISPGFLCLCNTHRMESSSGESHAAALPHPKNVQCFYLICLLVFKHTMLTGFCVRKISE